MTLSSEQIKDFKNKLDAEHARLIGELKTVGRINPDNPGDWEAVPEKYTTDQADRNEQADAIEEFEGNTAIVRELEYRLRSVKEALSAIEKGTYGTCSNCGKEIPIERLNANPAATTCVVDADKEE